MVSVLSVRSVLIDGASSCFLFSSTSSVIFCGHCIIVALVKILSLLQKQKIWVICSYVWYLFFYNYSACSSKWNTFLLHTQESYSKWRKTTRLLFFFRLGEILIYYFYWIQMKQFCCGVFPHLKLIPFWFWTFKIYFLE